MGRNRKKILREFIDSLPDAKLEGFPDGRATLYKDVDLRLDMQGVSDNLRWPSGWHGNCLLLTTSLGDKQERVEPPDSGQLRLQDDILEAICPRHSCWSGLGISNGPNNARGDQGTFQANFCALVELCKLPRTAP